MRRSTTITLLLLLLAAFPVPVVQAAAANALPACCRAGGRHHCSAVIVDATGREPQLQGVSCPHRKPVASPGCAGPPAAAETVAPADAHFFPNKFQAEFFVSHRELPYSQRAPPLAPSVN
jgi:hypothetical protein